MDDKETLNRRARLRELIQHCFEGNAMRLLDHIEGRTGVRPNQGEISGLQKNNGSRSFGDKKAKTLTEQIGLHRRWFDLALGTNLDPRDWETGPIILDEAHEARTADAKPQAQAGVKVGFTATPISPWPFKQISPRRVVSLSHDDLIRLEAAIIFAASQLGIDVKEPKAKPKGSGSSVERTVVAGQKN